MSIEGKAQEALGNLTGDKEMELEGKAKQVQSATAKAFWQRTM